MVDRDQDSSGEEGEAEEGRMEEEGEKEEDDEANEAVGSNPLLVAANLCGIGHCVSPSLPLSPCLFATLREFAVDRSHVAPSKAVRA